MKVLGGKVMRAKEEEQELGALEQYHNDEPISGQKGRGHLSSTLQPILKNRGQGAWACVFDGSLQNR